MIKEEEIKLLHEIIEDCELHIKICKYNLEVYPTIGGEFRLSVPMWEKKLVHAEITVKALKREIERLNSASK